MQAVYNDSSALDAASGMLFATGRDYMMRSEKRSRSGGGSAPSGEPRRPRPPKRRRRKRAGVFYKILMLLLLLLLWPVGLLMLWQRKVRWSVGMKLLTSVVTLAACIIVIAFALTINVNNAEYTAFQDRAHDFLDVAADTLIEGGNVVAKNAVIVYDGAVNLGDAAWSYAREDAIDLLDHAAAFGSMGREKVDELLLKLKGDGAEKPEATPEAEPDVKATPEASKKAAEKSASPAPKQSAKPSEEPVIEIIDELSVKASGAPSPKASEEAAEATPDAEAGAGADAGAGAGAAQEPEAEASPRIELPIFIPGADAVPAEGGSAIGSGTLSRSGELDESDVPVAIVTPEPTPEILDFPVKAAGDATVYYNPGGKCYHMAPKCGTMLSADEHLFSDTLQSSVRLCSLCGTPDKSILEEEFIVWTDEDDTAHISDECAAFNGGWNIIPAAQANEKGLRACTECGADAYLNAIAEGKTVTISAPEATPEPSAEPDAAPTVEPAAKPSAAPTATATAPVTRAPATASPATAAKASEEKEPAPTRKPMTITPTRRLMDSAEAKVFLEGKTIHLDGSCSAISASKTQTTLGKCAGSVGCAECAPGIEACIGGHCLWQDADGLCHIGSDCAAADGALRPVLRDEALGEGMKGCPDCKASEYLFPNTIINYDGIKK